jgi:hypothetical protein
MMRIGRGAARLTVVGFSATTAACVAAGQLAGQAGRALPSSAGWLAALVLVADAHLLWSLAVRVLDVWDADLKATLAWVVEFGLDTATADTTDPRTTALSVALALTKLIHLRDGTDLDSALRSGVEELTHYIAV